MGQQKIIGREKEMEELQEIERPYGAVPRENQKHQNLGKHLCNHFWRCRR